MLSKKHIRIFSLVIAIIFVVLSVGNMVLRVATCIQLEKPTAPPTDYSSDSEVDAWITYKKFCRNPVPYIILLLSGGYLISAIRKLKRKY